MTSIPPTKGLLRDGFWIKRIASVYSSEQISKWLVKIRYPEAENLDPLHFESNLDSLRTLLQHHLTTFPFENTSMHYTNHHKMNIGLDYLYERLVVNGSGSYCFGVNGLFLQMIRGLGYRAYSSSGRINTGPPDSPPTFLPFVHMVLFIQPIDGSNITYFVDASGGGSCLTQPILLADGEIVMGATPSEQHSLIRTSRTDSSLETAPDRTCADLGPKLEWRLMVTHLKPAGDSTTRVMYSFIEDEFFQADYEAANIGVYTSQSEMFASNVVCSKCFFLNEDESREITKGRGALSSHDDPPHNVKYLGRIGMEGRTIKKHTGTRTEIVKTMRTEKDRLDGLKEWFDIEIHPDAIVYIKGHVPAYE